jgi:ribosomal protein S18 acetylase RimI-like enzyme
MYKKEIYVYDSNNQPHRAVIRNYRREDFPALIEIQQECFPPPFPSELWWNEEQLSSHLEHFPEGAICAEIGGKVVGSITSLIIHFDENHPFHTWAEATDEGYIRNHDAEGNTLYVVDISVRPAYRKWGIGKLLLQALYELVIHKKLDRLLGGGRMPGYYRYAEQMGAEEYVQNVLAGKLHDPIITFMLRCGRTPLCVVPDYLEDEESRNYGVLMEWKNPFKIRVHS